MNCVGLVFAHITTSWYIAVSGLLGGLAGGLFS
ncbi:hypothetical protein CLV99_4262 [Sphingobacterium yanglingense]|uniref:Uncharacterized protein n=1 Tax=Sphingobacterium yanglingense TaxID=1437280 RepID=A0A4R6WAC5_9SPHI|nr:hypothetical protein CLV99_4262 [Sphingobacterium yanglingense]